MKKTKKETETTVKPTVKSNCRFCGNEIPKNKKYCNEECLIKSIESRRKPLITRKTKTINATEEIRSILIFLDRQDDKGDFRAENLTKLLRYCQIWRTGKFSDLIRRLSLRLGIDGRYIRKNYLDGLAIEGIISVIGDSWRWFGIPVFNDSSSTEENTLKGGE